MEHPGQIISRAQQFLIEVESDSRRGVDGDGDRREIETRTSILLAEVLGAARQSLDAFYARRPASRGASLAEAEPARTRMDIERFVFDILLGVMVRGAVFEALQLAIEREGEPSDDAVVDYTTAFVDRYSAVEGEHQFMTEMVARLDHGLFRYYGKLHAPIYRLALRDATHRLVEAERAYGKPMPPKLLREGRHEMTSDFEHGIWTCDRFELFATDVHDVRDRVRRALRHNAETAMLSVRLLPESIERALVESDAGLGHLTMRGLQDLFFRAIPTLVQPAGLRLRQPISDDSQSRHLQTPPAESLVCEVRGSVVSGFRWRDRRLERRRSNGRCPANADLPGLNRQQRELIVSLRAAHGWPWVRPSAALTMCTAEALLLLGGLVAPRMWRDQFEVHLLCTAKRSATCVAE